jgi:hypothetical protein
MQNLFQGTDFRLNKAVADIEDIRFHFVHQSADTFRSAAAKFHGRSTDTHHFPEHRVIFQMFAPGFQVCRTCSMLLDFKKNDLPADLIHPHILLPATTALGTLDPEGREKGILSGANVVMPNLSPSAVRKKYMLYNDKLSDGEESAECLDSLRRRMEAIGYRIVTARGDYKQN